MTRQDRTPLTAAHDAVTTLILPGPDAAGGPAWAEAWAASDPGVVVARLDEAYHALPEVRAFETAHLILANPGSIAVASGLGAAVLVQLLHTWPHLPLAGVLLVDPADPVRGTDHAAFGPLPEAALPVPAILYLSSPATPRDRALARAWDCLLAEATAADAAGEDDLPRLRSLCDQLARIRNPGSVPVQAEPVPDRAPAPPPPPAAEKRGLGQPRPLPRILF